MTKNTTAFLFTVVFFSFPVCFAGPSLTYHGRLLHSDNTPVTASGVQFKIQVLTPGPEECLLYEETQTKDLSASSGTFSINLNDGAGTRTDTSGYTFAKIFSNSASFSFASSSCTSGNSYAPSSSDGRKLKIFFNDGTGLEQIPVQAINYVPTAVESLQVQGFGAGSLLRVASSGTPQNVSALTPTNFTDLLAIINGTSNLYMRSSNSQGANLPSLSSPPTSLTAGQIWYDQSSNLIKYYNGTATQTLGVSGAGLSSLSVSSNLTAGGTAGGTLTGPGTIDLNNTGVTAGTYTKVTVDVKGRVSSGTSLTEADIPSLSQAGKVSGSALTSGTIGGSTAINTSGNILSSGTVQGATFSAASASGGHAIALQSPNALAADYTLTLPAALPLANGSFLTSDTSGILSWGSPTMTLTSGNIFVGSSGNVATSVAPSGDISLTNSGVFSVTGLRGKAISATSPSGAGQTLRYDGSSTWTPGFLSLADIRSTVTPGNTIFPSSPCNSGQTLTWSVLTDTMTCSNIALDAAAITSGTLSTSRLPSSLVVNGGNAFGSAATVGTTDNYNLKFITNNVTRMTLDTSGYLGVGVASPTSPLDVLGAIKSSHAQGSVYLYPGTYPSVQGLNSSGTMTTQWIFDPGAGGAYIDYTGTPGGGTGQFSIRNKVNTPANTVLKIDHNGNVGIGTTSPNYLLDVQGAISIRDASASRILMSYDGTSRIRGIASGGLSLESLHSSGTPILFQVGTTALSEAMRIQPSGNVGIGTTSPNATLQVGGTITGKAATSNSGSTINFSSGNLQYTTNDCGAFNLNNMKDGGSYAFAVQGSTAALCTFNAYSDAGTTALTVHMPPNHGLTTANTHTLYNFMVLGTHVYVSWVPGY